MSRVEARTADARYTLKQNQVQKKIESLSWAQWHAVQFWWLFQLRASLMNTLTVLTNYHHLGLFAVNTSLLLSVLVSRLRGNQKWCVGPCNSFTIAHNVILHVWHTTTSTPHGRSVARTKHCCLVSLSVEIFLYPIFVAIGGSFYPYKDITWNFSSSSTDTSGAKLVQCQPTDLHPLITIGPSIHHPLWGNGR